MLPKLWKTATVIPLPKERPPESIENDIRPIALTPILAKVFESRYKIQETLVYVGLCTEALAQ